MRIGIDCRSLQEPFPSGVSVYTRELLTALFALPEAEEHTFVCFLNSAAYRGYTSGDPLPIPEVNQVIAPEGGPTVEWRVRSLPNKVMTAGEVVAGRPGVRWMFGDVDVVFVPNMQFYPFRDVRVPYVLTVHDLTFELYPECLDRKGRWRHRLLFPRQFVQHAAHVVTVSDYTAHDVQRLYAIPQERVTTIYPGLPPVPTSSHQYSASTTHTDAAPYMLLLSTVEPRKNIATALHAYAQVREHFPELRCIVAGGAGWKSRSILQLMKDTPGVEYRGYITEQEKQDLLQNANMFVYTSLYEGFGFPPLEALQYGVPTIVGGHSSLPEVVGDSALIVDVHDVHSVARAMTHVYTDAALRNRYQQRAEHTLQRFSWEESARDMFHQLRHAADNHSDEHTK